MSRSFLLGFILVLFFTGCASRIPPGAPVAWSFDEGERIPTNYSTYTLFLNTSYEYAEQETLETLTGLRTKFARFGKSVGKENLAVWVNEPGTGDLSVARGKYYLDIFDKWSDAAPLEYSSGPYVVVTDTHPDELKTASDGKLRNLRPIVIAISFQSVSTNRVTELLNVLEKRIRTGEIDSAEIGLKVFSLSLKSWWNDNEDKQFLKDITLALLSRA